MQIRLTITDRRCEVCRAVLSFTEADGSVISTELNFDGNAASSALWGARTVVETLNRMMDKTGEHHESQDTTE